MSLFGWLQGYLQRDRERRDAIRAGKRLRTGHARAAWSEHGRESVDFFDDEVEAQARWQRRTGNSR